MTSFSPTDRFPRRGGFTIIELLVVMAIIVLIIGITLPVLVHARKSAAAARMSADLQVISQALDAYHQDFRDYPRVDYSGMSPIALPDRLGAVTLCWALVAPGPATQDGSDGPGFRPRGVPNANTGAPTGQVYGPYIQPDNFTITGTDDTNSTINDTHGNPYLYFVAFKAANINVAAGYVAKFIPTTPPTAGAVIPMYNYNDNPIVGTSNTFSLGSMQAILGASGDGGIDQPGETPSVTAPYILWCAGPDELWGLDPNTGKTDDVTNFDIPPNLRK